MAKIYDSIRREIDSLIIKILDLSEQEIKYKLELEKLMNSGYVNIAKARYIMGSQSVSMLQLPTENSTTSKALSRVHREDYKGCDIFKLQIIKPASQVDKTSEASNESATGLRERKGKTISTDVDNKDDFLDDVTIDSEFSDPIRLFGVLVPFTLKTAQQFFKDSLFVIVKCATIQSELNSALNRHNHLLQMKLVVHKAILDKSLNGVKNVENDETNTEAR